MIIGDDDLWLEWEDEKDVYDWYVEYGEIQFRRNHVKGTINFNNINNISSFYYLVS